MMEDTKMDDAKPITVSTPGEPGIPTKPPARLPAVGEWVWYQDNDGKDVRAEATVIHNATMINLVELEHVVGKGSVKTDRVHTSVEKKLAGEANGWRF